MTDKELQQLKDTLPKWKNGKPPVLTEEQKQLDEKLWCIEMINSILIYYGKVDIMKNPYLSKYIASLGKEVVENLIDEQIKEIEQATILENVSVDCDGISYNSIIWKDEK